MQAEHDELIATLASLVDALRVGGCLESDYRAAKLQLMDATAMAHQLGRAQFHARCDDDAQSCRDAARDLKYA